VNYTAIPCTVEQGLFREPPVLKTGVGSLQCEQNPCNESRFSLRLKQVFPVRITVFIISGTSLNEKKKKRKLL
jgi:hypothetical protein